MTAELARLSGKDYAYILRSEGGSMIKIAALASPIASKAEIERQVTERAGTHYVGDGGEIFVNVRKNKGRVWFTDDHSHIRGPNGRGYMVFDAGPTRGHHLPGPVWNEYLLTGQGRALWIKQRIAELAARRGLERLSWIQMGDAMGVSLSAIAPAGNINESQARAANVHGRQFQNGSAREFTDGANFVIVVTNDSPIAVKRSGQTRLDAAINQRFRGFEYACQKGLLADLTRRAARWPGIFVKPL